MGRKRKHNTTFEERQLVIFHHAKGKSHRMISKILNISRTTVGDIVRRFKNEDRIESIPQTGRPKKLNDREERFVVRKVKENPKISAPKISAAVLDACGKKVGVETVRRALRRNEYGGRRSRRQPYISAVNKKKRCYSWMNQNSTFSDLVIKH